MQTSNDTAQHWDARRYTREAGFVAEGGRPLLELLAPRAGERVLDLGCGPGTLTRELAAAGAEVVGVDSSATMLADARARYPELTFREADGQSLAFDHEFDAVFSNAALHWMPRAADVARGVFRALRPGGRFVAEFGGHGNVAHVRAAVARALAGLGVKVEGTGYGPWYFPRLGEYAALLEQQGFEVRFAHAFARPTPMPDRDGKSGVVSWLGVFAHPLLERLDAQTRARFERFIEDETRAALFRDGVWWIDYVRLRVEAVVPAAGA